MSSIPLVLAVVAGVLATSPAGTFLPATVASPDELLAAVRTYETTVNRHDWRAVASLLSDNVTIDLGGGETLVGIEAVRRLHGWERSLATEIHYSDCAVDGDRVTCRAVETNEFTRLAGLAPVVYAASELRFAGGRVVRMSATLDEASASAVGRALLPFLAWARAYGPASVSTFIRPDGSFDFNDEAGEQFTRLLRIYRALHRRTAALRA
jgi:hypothetical protein